MSISAHAFIISLHDILSLACRKINPSRTAFTQLFFSELLQAYNWVHIQNMPNTSALLCHREFLWQNQNCHPGFIFTLNSTFLSPNRLWRSPKFPDMLQPGILQGNKSSPLFTSCSGKVYVHRKIYEMSLSYRHNRR